MWLPVLVAVFLQAAAPSMRTVGKGPASAIEEARQVVVRTPAEWTALWQTHTGGRSGSEPPALDFSREMVLGVFSGSRPTGGYGVEIVRTVAANGRLLVEFVESSPGASTIAAQVVTAPFHLVAVPRMDGAVQFTRVDR